MNSHHLLNPMLVENQIKFSSTENILWASQQNSIAAFSWTTKVAGDLNKQINKQTNEYVITWLHIKHNTRLWKPWDPNLKLRRCYSHHLLTKIFTVAAKLKAHRISFEINLGPHCFHGAVWSYLMFVFVCFFFDCLGELCNTAWM